LGALPVGKKIQLGREIKTNQQGNSPKGDFEIKSDGNGAFTVKVHGSGNSQRASVVPNYDKTAKNTVTVVAKGELYAIKGTRGPNHSTSLSFLARCAIPPGTQK
jgi:hypothetical protein